MKTISSFLILLLGFIFATCLGSSGNKEDKIDTAEFRAVSAEFMAGLKKILISEMKDGGPVNAISVCADTAQAMTKKFGNENNIIIKRVTRKPRNKLNTPDNFELKVLNDFEQLNSSGKITKTTEHAEVVENSEGKFIRYMKPIIVQAPCLNCQGDKASVSPETEKLIAEYYPEDTARDYKAGDLRGAISILKKVK